MLSPKLEELDCLNGTTTFCADVDFLRRGRSNLTALFDYALGMPKLCSKLLTVITELSPLGGS